MRNLPIGVFDSGLGGLSVLKAIRKTLPNENLIYIADNKYVPYGNREEDELKERAFQITQFFTAIPVKAIVVACNTATATTIQYLRDQFELPIIGVEPGIKPACEITNSGEVGVMATAGTLSSQKYENLKNLHGKDVTVHEHACEGLVAAIESEYPDFDETLKIIKNIIVEFREKNVDAVVLGCTHYPLIERLIQKEFHQAVTINTNPAIARQLKRRLRDRNLLNSDSHIASITYLASHAHIDFKDNIARIMTSEEALELIQLPDWCIEFY